MRAFRGSRRGAIAWRRRLTEPTVGASIRPPKPEFARSARYRRFMRRPLPPRQRAGSSICAGGRPATGPASLPYPRDAEAACCSPVCRLSTTLTGRSPPGALREARRIEAGLGTEMSAACRPGGPGDGDLRSRACGRKAPEWKSRRQAAMRPIDQILGPPGTNTNEWRPRRSSLAGLFNESVKRVAKCADCQAPAVAEPKPSTTVTVDCPPPRRPAGADCIGPDSGRRQQETRGSACRYMQS